MSQEKCTHEEVHIQPEIQSHYLSYEANDYLISRHWHPHLEILYIAKGDLYVGTGDNSFLLSQGQMAVINSREIHSTRCVGLTKVILLQVPYEILRSSIPNFEQIRFRNQVLVTSSKDDPGKLILELNAIYEKKENGWQLRFQSLLYQLLYEIYRLGHEEVSPAMRLKSERNLTRLESITEYVQEHYAEPITLEEAAQIVGFNPEYFCRFFKKYMGVTFFTYVNTIRLTHIHDELLTTEDTVTTLLERHGFRNYRLFRRMFREAYGCTPMKLRKS